ncbi:MAG TPA: hypothetical protein VJ783_22445 [Pirellulales bacterium]|nr:hypothetical protein [Pirellulales bacterium]
MRRPQFTLKTLLWLTALVGAFLGGMAAQARLERPSITHWQDCGNSPDVTEILTTRDGKKWVRAEMLEEDDALRGPSDGE